MKILGIKVDNVSFFETINKISEFINSKKSHQIVTVNPEFIISAQKDKEFAKVLNESSLSIPDGTGLIFASRFLYGKKNKLKERVAGVDLVWELAKISSQKGWSIYFLGAKPNIAKKAANRLKLLHRNLEIAGISEGEPKFSEKETIEMIKKSNADILLVSYGAPKQDKFIYKNLNELGVKVAIGVGGTFDFITEVQKRAPIWIQKIGLEWFWRLIHEPKRIKRIYNAIIKFPILVIWSKIS